MSKTKALIIVLKDLPNLRISVSGDNFTAEQRIISRNTKGELNYDEEGNLKYVWKILGYNGSLKSACLCLISKGELPDTGKVRLADLIKKQQEIRDAILAEFDEIQKIVDNA